MWFLFRIIALLCMLGIYSLPLHADDPQPQSPQQNQALDQEQALAPQEPLSDQPGDEESERPKLINNITIIGNTLVTSEAILNRIPYKKGEVFNPAKTSILLRNLYNFGYFRDIEVMGEDVSSELMNLYVVVKEKNKLDEIKFEGNAHLSEKEIQKKIDFSKIPAVDEEELKKFTSILKQLYLDKGYHFVTITPSYTVKDNKATVLFTIEEGKHSVVRQVLFEGNKHISAKRLRSVMYTREDWLLSFLDSAGSFHPEALEMDKYTIETTYKNHGYLAAKVVNVDVDMDTKTKNFFLTFHIEEGPLYTISDVKVTGNEIMSEEELLRILPLRPNELYSQAKVQKSMEIMRNLWGERGYIYADIDPAIQSDDEKKTVAITFYSELGNKVRLNRINVIGNKKSRDFVIRRQILLDEGDIITTQKMEFSKNRVELLGYFDKKNGVNWKMNRVSEDLCDLDLILKEVPTGQLSLQAGFNGNANDITDPTRALTLSIGFANTNLAGYGIHYDVNAALSRAEQTGNFSLFSPWIYNQPISGAFNFFANRSQYQDLHNVSQEVTEKRVGASLGFGIFLDHPRDTHMQLQLGYENLFYGSPPKAVAKNIVAQAEFQGILNRRFQAGNLVWASYVLNQDMRNHPMHPSRGYQWLASAKFGAPTAPANLGFIKVEADASWYTPLIGESDLILCLHAHAGIVNPVGSSTIPYRELYHIGGPASVRGFLFGQIGPAWENESIGGKKALWTNIELLFPIKPDFSIKGSFFYDGGAGWDTPDANCISPLRLRNNDFRYRHAVGVGIRMLQPTPVQIDWGFKLDRNKKIGEPESEVHFSMIHNF
jgi:outer membrane protein insertion porin family